MTVGYHGGQIQIPTPLLQFINITLKELINNLFIRNKRNNISPFFVDSSSCKTCTYKEVKELWKLYIEED